MRRANERESMRNIKVLGDILGEFYTFLEKTPKPSDEEVRAEFIRQDERWHRYCKSHKLTQEASLAFNNEVAVSWRNRYAAKSKTDL